MDSPSIPVNREGGHIEGDTLGCEVVFYNPLVTNL